ncbi:MAG: DUF4215 domain-containing protein [Deltaproteobacteria bacterium]|nr:DUF4215 domain-containing protein [Nannocystaceae bacterium]
MNRNLSGVRGTLLTAVVVSSACSTDAPSSDSGDSGGIGITLGNDESSTGNDTGSGSTTGDTSTGGEGEDICGDGERGVTEACDDGNVAAGDGCDATCTVEPLFGCPVPDAPCVAIVCGDKKVESPEVCDDGNDQAGDGCDASCALEDGYACLLPGTKCQAAECGDGVLAGFEICDDGNAATGDGCNDTCKLEAGFYCPDAAAACVPTVCGDADAQGLEHCDDGNLLPYDGCSPVCANEPSCSGGECEAICGDGIILPGTTEDCDDGNNFSGDGCSSSCEVEAGFECTLQDIALPDPLRLPILFRDVRGWNHPAEPRHIDFNNGSGSGITFGMVEVDLAADRLPAADPAFVPTSASYHSVDSFHQWYRDTPGTNLPIVDWLDLPSIASNGYEFDSNAFFPLDGRGYADPLSTDPETLYADHNFNFTSEIRYWFEFAGDEELAFRGDDDVWVFVDGHLCLDIGGLHGAVDATMNLGDPTAEPNATQRAIVQSCVDRLDVGKVYELAVFHAERHTTQSNFRLTLSGFVTQTSECDWVCGDGIVTPFEVCDDGTENNTGGFGMCNADCLGIGPYCGDGILDPEHEECDLAELNVGSYDGCNADCTLGPYCGNGVRDGEDEECDAGDSNGVDGGSCRDNCTLTPIG